VADAFDTATQQAEEQRRAAMAAIASGGSAGAQAYAQGQAEIQAARSAALNAALADAAARGQQNVGGAVQSVVGRPYDQLNAGLASAAASNAADTATRTAAADRYFRELGSAIPVARTQLETSIAQAKQKAAADAAAKQAELSDSELRTRLMGAGELMRDQEMAEYRHNHHLQQKALNQKKAQFAQVDAQIAANKKQGLRVKNSQEQANLVHLRHVLGQQVQELRRPRNLTTQALKNPAPVESYARSAGVEAGYAPERVAGLIQMPGPSKQPLGASPSLEVAAQRAGIGRKMLGRLTASPPEDKDARPAWEQSHPGAVWFGRVSGQVPEAIKNGVPFEKFMSDVNTQLPKSLRRTRALIFQLYGPAFAAAGLT